MPKPRPPVNFYNARFKLLRARQLIKELDFEIQYLVNREIDDFNTLDKQAFQKYWHESMIRPALLALILGDTVHNLRSALDLMAIEIVRRNRKSIKGVYFPFAPSKGKLAEQIRKKKFIRASPAAIKELHGLKPYKRGNRALRALHDLDIMDKHKLILPTITSQETSFKIGKFPIGAWADDVCPKCGTTLRQPERDAETYIRRGNLTFGRGTPAFRGKEVVPTLHRLAQTVEAIIDRFAVVCR